jgi:hypothetical protein
VTIARLAQGSDPHPDIVFAALKLYGENKVLREEIARRGNPRA